MSRGAAPSAEQQEDRLSQVKALLRAKLSKDADDEEDEDIPWIASRGATPSTDQLADRLPTVKDQASRGVEVGE